MTGASVQSRKTVRKAFATLLQTELGSLVAVVYDHQADSLDEQSPAVTVTGGETDRTLTPGIMENSTIALYVDIFVRYQQQSATPPWTEADSEDRIDDIEQVVSNTVLKYGSNLEGDKSYPWLLMVTSGQSNINPAIMDGIDYRHESIRILCEVSNTA